MRCSICDRKESKYIYGHYHCSECEEVITQTIGNISDEDTSLLVDPEADDWLVWDGVSLDEQEGESIERDS